MTNELKQIAIQLLPALIERASIVSRHGVSTNFEFNHEAVVKQAYKFAEEVVRQDESSKIENITKERLREGELMDKIEKLKQELKK